MDRLISEQELLKHFDTREDWVVVQTIKVIPSAEPKAGHCEECKHFHKLPYHADTLGKCFNHMGLCPKGDWYCADFEPQDRRDKE